MKATRDIDGNVTIEFDDLDKSRPSARMTNGNTANIEKLNLSKDYAQQLYDCLSQQIGKGQENNDSTSESAGDE